MKMIVSFNIIEILIIYSFLRGADCICPACFLHEFPFKKYNVILDNTKSIKTCQAILTVNCDMIFKGVCKVYYNYSKGLRYQILSYLQPNF